MLSLALNTIMMASLQSCEKLKEMHISHGCCGENIPLTTPVDTSPIDRFHLIKDTQRVRIGTVNSNNIGLGFVDDSGNRSGIDVTQSRAVAFIALNGRSDFESRIEWVLVNGATRMSTIQDGTVDFTFRTTTNLQRRDESNYAGGLKLSFGPTMIYDGMKIQTDNIIPHDTVENFLRYIYDYNKERDVSCEMIDGHAILTTNGTTYNNTNAIEKNVGNANLLRVSVSDDGTGAENMKLLWLKMGYSECDFNLATKFCLNGAACVSAYRDLSSIAYASDSSALVSQIVETRRIHPTKNPVIFPDVALSEEPLAGFMQDGSPKLKHIMDWSMYALIKAGDFELTKNNIATKLLTLNSRDRAFFEDNASLKSLGLDGNLFRRLIEQFGSWTEIWNENLTPLGMPMGGRNNYARLGGLYYTPPY